MVKAGTRILVLCTGNSCRSQMTEGLLRHYGGESLDVSSAGLEPKGLNPHAVRVMTEIGIDISRQVSEHIQKYAAESFDYVITVCDSAAERCPVFPGNAIRLHWPFEDPARISGTEEDILEVFRGVRDKIGRKVQQWIAEVQLAHKR